MGHELLLEDHVSLVDLAQVAAVRPEHRVVVPVGRGEAGVDVVEQLVVELHLLRVELDLGVEPRAEDALQEPARAAPEPARRERRLGAPVAR